MTTRYRSTFGTAMSIGERRRGDPCSEGILVTPTSDDEPLVTAVGGLEELETLEAIGSVDGTSPGGEPMSKFIARLCGNSDGIDANDGHGLSWLPSPAGRASPDHP